MEELQTGTLNIQVQINNILKDISVNHGNMLSNDMTTIKIPDSNCAYIITTQSNKLYIGSSRSPRARMVGHKIGCNGTFKDNGETIRHVTLYYTDTYPDTAILEYWLIKQLRPELNKRV